jgi:phosphatidylglycerol lysyltransferase
LALVGRFGRTGTAFQVMSRGVSHWFDTEVDGMVAYQDTGRAWVAAGEPVSAVDDAIPVAERFVVAAAAHGRRACFFATEGILSASTRFHRFPLGEQPTWDPERWDASVRAHRSLREQLRRARAKSVRVRRIQPDEFSGDPALTSKLEAVVQHWLAARPMPPMHFLVETDPFLLITHRQLFIAEQQDTVVGLLSLVPVPVRTGWLFEHLLRDPFAPNGTSELLVDTAMRSLAHDGVRWATLGLAPLAGDMPRWLRWVRTLCRPLFNFDGLATFKRKLSPQQWEPIYLVHPTDVGGITSLIDGLRAFAGGALWKFGLRTALRGPRPLLTALERLLIPWTILLAVAPTGTWFPSPAIHVAWVLFDVGLYLLLRSVRQRSWLAGATVAAGAVTVDAILTMWQAIAWNAPRVSTWGAAVLTVIACAGPLITAPILWGAVRRLRQIR